MDVGCTVHCTVENATSEAAQFHNIAPADD